MRVKVNLKVTVVGKNISLYKNQLGEEKKSCSVNCLQDDGQIVATLKVTEEIFAMLERGKEYILDGEYSETKYGNNIKITGINNSAKVGA